MADELIVGGVAVPRGKRVRIELDSEQLFDQTHMSIPVEVVRGRRDGPVLFVTAAIHGDEICGAEAIKRLLRLKTMSRIRGTLIAVPIVNVFGYNSNVRYTPDRRDLNRCFPGSSSGSLASRIAHVLMTEVVTKCTHGIDLHSAAVHRDNYPQVRACLDDPETERLAKAFGVPVVINATLRDGSLRQSVADLGIPMLLFEGGEALRYNEKVIRAAYRGILAVMRSIGMLPQKRGSGQSPKRPPKTVHVARSSYWVRAPQSGSLTIQKRLGSPVEKGEQLGVISDPFGERRVPVNARKAGLLIGHAVLPLVNGGDGLFHVATFDRQNTPSPSSSN